VEPQKRAKYSKSCEPDEIEEVLMDEESDEELEETNKVMEPLVQSSSSLEDADDTEETEVKFRATISGDSSNVLDFTGPSNGINRSATSDCYAKGKFYNN